MSLVIGRNMVVQGTVTAESVITLSGAGTISGLDSSHVGLNNVQNNQNNMNGTEEPTITDDTTEGYSVGSIWRDTSNNYVYVCVDNTENSAIWKKTSVREFVGSIKIHNQR